ncbi:MAG: MurR/RpiR family transcriptional regulator [Faecalibacterium sp.]
MPDANVFTKITNEYYQLTSAEKKISDYVVIHQHQTQYMSISELAEECGVAEATVSRFCKRLNYKGYNAFKLAIANSTATHGTRNPLAGEVRKDDSFFDMCQKVYDADVDAVRQTLALVRAEEVIAAAEVLLHADKVICMGQGGSMILAQEAAHLFSTARTGFFAIWDSHLQIVSVSQLGAQDAVLFFSYSGSTKELLEVLSVVKQRGAKSILITHFPKSPGAGLADVVLQCGALEGPMQLGSVAARMAQLFLTDVLFSEVCRRDLEACQARRETIAEALAEKHL